MDGYYWRHLDHGAVYCKVGELWGYRTKGEVVRCKDLGGELYFTARVPGLPLKVGFDNKEDAQRYVETVVALRGDGK